MHTHQLRATPGHHCRAQGYTKEKNQKAESIHRMPCDIQRKFFPLDWDQICELQEMTCCTDECPVATTACTRPVKVQGRQNSGMEKGGQ